ncbi:hypothetical protein FQZ97_763220 [compost metagenome]
MSAAGYVANGGQGPGGQDAGVHRRVQVVDDLFHGDDAALGRQGRFLLHAEDAPEQHVALAVGLLRVDHGHVRAYRGHGGQLFAGEGAVDELDVRVDLRQVGAGVGTQDRERQARGAGHIGVGQVGVAVFVDLQGVRPLFLYRVAQAVQRAHAGVATPGEGQLAGAARADQQVIDQVGGHAHQVQVFLALADDLVGGGSGNQVGEALEGYFVAIVDEAFDGFAERKDFSHGRSRVVIQGDGAPGDEKVPPPRPSNNPIIDYSCGYRTYLYLATKPPRVAPEDICRSEFIREGPRSGPIGNLRGRSATCFRE